MHLRGEKRQMPTIVFSDKAISKLAIPPTGRTVFHDTKEPSLSLRIDCNGRRSFFWLRNGPHRKNIFRSLGEHPSITTDKARQEARGLTSTLAAWRLAGYQGANPFAVACESTTLLQAFDLYAKKRLASHSARPEKAEAADRWMLEKYCSDLANRPLDGITDKDIRAKHRHVGEKHGKTIANRVVQMLRRIYEWSILKEKLVSCANPARGIDFFPSHKRKRFLDPAELTRLHDALQAESNVDLRDFVLLSLFTGARRGDVSSMAWKDIVGNIWNIPSPKGGVEAAYSVQLPAAAVEILAARRARLRALAIYVFPGTGKTGHITEWKRSFGQLLKRAKIEDLHVHDLRRTMASWQAGLGYSLPTIGASLGHAPGSSATSVYARLDVSVVRNAVESTVSAMGWKTKAAPASKPPRKAKAARRLLTVGKDATAGA